MNRKWVSLCVLFLLLVLSIASTITHAAEKSDMQVAKELIYGKWARANSDWVKYEFSENNIQVLNASRVDPYGESSISVKMKNSQGQWITFNTLFLIELRNNKYHLQIIQRRSNGNQVVGYEDQNVDYIKVYWKDKD